MSSQTIWLLTIFTICYPFLMWGIAFLTFIKPYLNSSKEKRFLFIDFEEAEDRRGWYILFFVFFPFVFPLFIVAYTLGIIVVPLLWIFLIPIFLLAILLLALANIGPLIINWLRNLGGKIGDAIRNFIYISPRYPFSRLITFGQSFGMFIDETTSLYKHPKQFHWLFNRVYWFSRYKRLTAIPKIKDLFDQIVRKDVAVQVSYIMNDKFSTRQRQAGNLQLSKILLELRESHNKQLMDDICGIVLQLVKTEILDDYYRIEAAKILEGCSNTTYSEQAWLFCSNIKQPETLRLQAAEKLDALNRRDIAKDVLRDLITSKNTPIIRIKAASRLGMMGVDADGVDLYKFALGTLEEIIKEYEIYSILLHIAEAYVNLDKHSEAETIFMRLAVSSDDGYIARRAINNLGILGENSSILRYRNGEPLWEIVLNAGVKITIRTKAAEMLTQLSINVNRDDVIDKAVDAWQNIARLMTTSPDVRYKAAMSLKEIYLKYVDTKRPNIIAIKDFIRQVLWEIGCDNSNPKSLRSKSANVLREIDCLSEANTINLYVGSSQKKIEDVIKDVGKIFIGKDPKQ